MSADLYAVLGVTKGASPEQIKRAYRNKAKKAHPDAGGDKESFDRIAVAYAVLSDPDARKRYDETGEYDAGSALNELAAVYACINGVLTQIVSADDQALQQDLVKVISNTLGNEIVNQRKALGKLATASNKAKRMQGRFRRKQEGGENIFDGFLAFHLAQIAGVEKNLKGQIALKEKAIALLKDYAFEPEKMQVAMVSIFGGSSSTFSGV